MLRVAGLVAGVIMLLLGGCSQYVDDFDYAPRPAVAEIAPTPPQQVPPVTAFVSVPGIRREDKKEGVPASVEVRMRMDNNGPQPVTFDPASMQLSNGELLKFMPPLLLPAQPPFALAPSQTSELTAYFAFPPGHSYDDTNLDILQLTWIINIDGHPMRQYANFHRVAWGYYYYDPYWPYPYPVVGGVVSFRGRWR